MSIFGSVDKRYAFNSCMKKLPHPFESAEALKATTEGRIVLVGDSGRVLAAVPLGTAFDLSDGESGNGFGPVYGSGAGDGFNGDGYGYGYGYGYGSVSGSGYGYGYGDGDGDGYGDGSVSGSGYGSPKAP